MPILSRLGFMHKLHKLAAGLTLFLATSAPAFGEITASRDSAADIYQSGLQSYQKGELTKAQGLFLEALEKSLITNLFYTTWDSPTFSSIKEAGLLAPGARHYTLILIFPWLVRPCGSPQSKWVPLIREP